MDTKELTITGIFSRAAEEFSQKTALQIKKDASWQRFTYAEVKDNSLKLGALLIKEGFKKGEAVALILENCPEWAMIYLGIMRAGLICVPLDQQLSREEIRNLASDSEAKAIFCSKELFSGKIKEACSGFSIKVFILEEFWPGLNAISAEGILWPGVSSADIASLIYTSGTTGKPKGVLLSQGNFCSNFLSLKKANIAKESDNFLTILPLYHSYAFTASLLLPLLTGATITFTFSLNARDLTAVIKDAGVTALIGVPQIFSSMHRSISERMKKIPLIFRPFAAIFIREAIKRRMGSLRISASGGARLEPKTARELLRFGIKVVEGYGLTEASPVVAINQPEKVRFGSVGRPISDVSIKIRNPDSQGVGSVLIKGPNVMQGYYKDAKLTQEVIKDGWLHTSDLGFIDREGYLYLTGRKEDVLVLSSGKTIYPEELEEHYGQTPYIKEICIILKQEKVFGYAKDSLYAVVVPDLEYFAKKKQVNIDEKIRWDLDSLGRDLPSYKHIMGVTLRTQPLPRTPLQKIQRFAVMQEYLKEEENIERKEKILTEEEKALMASELGKKIIGYISKEITRPVGLNSHLEIDLGIDSLTRVELGLGLEALLGIKIPDEMLYEVSTVKDVIVNLEKTSGRERAKKEPEARKEWVTILREEPPKDILNKIKLDFGLTERLLTLLFKCVIFAFMFRLFWLLRAEGRKNLPKEGPYLICSNHASYLDGLFIFTSLPFAVAMKTYFLGYRHILEHPLLRWVNRIARFLSINTNSRLAEAMNAVAFVLAHKKNVCIFPEGMRSIDAEVKKFKSGIGILMKELDIPCVPAYIKGSHNSWPRGSRVPHFCRVKVIFGRPVSWRQLGNNYEEIAASLREKVLKLQAE